MENGKTAFAKPKLVACMLVMLQVFVGGTWRHFACSLSLGTKSALGHHQCWQRTGTCPRLRFLGRLTAYSDQGEMPDLMNTVYFSLKYLNIWQLYGHEIFEPSPSQGRGFVGTSRRAKCLWWWWCTQGPRRQVLPGEVQPFAFRGFPWGFVLGRSQRSLSPHLSQISSPFFCSTSPIPVQDSKILSFVCQRCLCIVCELLTVLHTALQKVLPCTRAVSHSFVWSVIMCPLSFVAKAAHKIRDTGHPH